MSTALLTQTDTSALLSMSPEETSKTVAQMTALMNAMASEKDNIDSMAAMLEKQPWYKKMWFTISGKNKATVKDIQQSKDKLTAYTANALAELYKNSRIEQAQIIAVGQAVNFVNSQLAATNYELIKTQEAFAEFKAEIIDTIGSLANALNEKIMSIDSYHMLMEEITVGSFDYENIIASLFSIIAQIDKRTAEDSRKMDILRKSMTNKGYLNDNELPITEYMNCVATLPDNVIGTIYYEFSCLNGNDYAEMFCKVIENYSMLPKMEKKSKKLDVIINGILESHNVDRDTSFSTNEIYDYFIEGKIDYLTTIHEYEIPTDDSEPSNQDSEIKPDVNYGENNIEPVELDDTNITNEISESEQSILKEESNNIPKELSEISLENIMSISSGETKEFKYQKIHFNSMIQCFGNLVFDHCVIYYNEPNSSSGITLENNSSIAFCNCKIVCKGVAKKYFINSEHNIFSANFENTEFVDCTGFFTGDGGCIGFNVANCIFTNCFLGLINIHNAKDDYMGKIENCIFLLDNLPAYLNSSVLDSYDSFKNSDLGYYHNDSVIKLPCQINNFFAYCSLSVKTGLASKFISTGFEGRITNCTFIGLGLYFSVSGGYFQKCKFINCKASANVEYDPMDKKSHYVENSVFSNSGNLYISGPSGYSSTSVSIRNCQFDNIKDTIIHGSGSGIIVEFCEFTNIDVSGIKLRFGGPFVAIQIDYSDAKCSKVTNCVFNGWTLGNNCMVGANSAYGKLKGYAISVEKCSFRNIKTSRSDNELIKKNASYLNLFSQSKEVLATKISDCTGLDMINKLGYNVGNVVLKKNTSSGETIGATIDESLLNIGIGVEFDKDSNNAGLQHRKYKYIIHWQNILANSSAVIIQPYSGNNGVSIAHLIHNKTGLDVEEAEKIVSSGGIVEATNSTELVEDLKEYGIEVTAI